MPQNEHLGSVVARAQAAPNGGSFDGKPDSPIPLEWVPGLEPLLRESEGQFVFPKAPPDIYRDASTGGFHVLGDDGQRRPVEIGDIRDRRAFDNEGREPFASLVSDVIERSSPAEVRETIVPEYHLLNTGCVRALVRKLAENQAGSALAAYARTELSTHLKTFYAIDHIDAVCDAHKAGDEEAVKVLLESLKERPSPPNSGNFLHVAANFQRTGLVKALVETGPFDADTVSQLILMRDGSGINALHAAVRGRAADMTTLMLDVLPSDLRTRAVMERDAWDGNVLKTAAFNTMTDIVEIMLTRIPADKAREAIARQDESGDTLLHIAADRGDERMVTLMLNILPDDQRGVVVRRENKGGNTPFGLAWRSGDDRKIDAIRRWLD